MIHISHPSHPWQILLSVANFLLFLPCFPRMSKVPESGECCGCANWTETLGIPVPDGGAGEATFGRKFV